MGRTLLVQQFRTGGARNLGYLAADTHHRVAAVIDPSFSPEVIVHSARTHRFAITYAFDTHGHDDHTNGDARFASPTGVWPLHFGEVDPETGIRVADGATFPLGDYEILIIYTPGHSPDSVCILVGGALFTGDTLFVGNVGGTDLLDGARQQYESLHEKLLLLPDETLVYPGHDVGLTASSTLGREKTTNPFLLQPDLQSFLRLKRFWPAYEREHGMS